MSLDAETKKRPWKAKALWASFIVSALVLAVPGADEFYKQHPKEVNQVIDFIIFLIDAMN